ncbi:unnamed protein product [Lactuca virosa]|uniref:Uncharacterized protein n=1 Tax=Lactuca virosa TaxID=75947 RepID=A0AAU9MZG3_9ASTR|nr:unnamed protein product [Lactuca virosa]
MVDYLFEKSKKMFALFGQTTFELVFSSNISRLSYLILCKKYLMNIQNLLGNPVHLRPSCFIAVRISILSYHFSVLNKCRHR